MKWPAQWRENWSEAGQDRIWLGFANGRVTYWQATFIAVLGMLCGLGALVMLITSHDPHGSPSKDEEPEVLYAVIFLFGSFALMTWGLTLAAVLGISRALLKQLEDLKRRLDERDGSDTPQDGGPKA